MSYLSGDYANNDIPLNGEDANSVIYNGGNIWTGDNTATGNNTFTGNNSFTNDNTFSGNNSFSGGNTFYGSNTFSGNNSFTGTNTHTGTETFTTINLLNKFNIQQANIVTNNFQSSPSVSGNLNLSAKSSDTVVIVPSTTAITYTTTYVTLPLITSNTIGAKVRVMLGGAIISGYAFNTYIRNSTGTQQIFYNGGRVTNVFINVGLTSNLGYPAGYEFVAINATSNTWAVTSITWSSNVITQNANNFSALQTISSGITLTASNNITSPFAPVSFYNAGRSYYAGSTYYDGLITSNNNFTSNGTFTQYANNTISTGYEAVSYLNAGKCLFSDNLWVSAGYLMPVFPLVTNSTPAYRIGQYAMQYLDGTSLNCIAFGQYALRGVATPGSGYVSNAQRSIAIGNNALSLQTGVAGSGCYDNVVIGHNGCQNSFYAINNLVAIGANVISGGGSGSSNSVVIGSNIGSGANDSNYQDCVVIGSNVCSNLGVNLATIIGANNLQNATFSLGYANSATIIGANNCLNATDFNRLIIIGSGNLGSLDSQASIICIGDDSMASLTTGFFTVSIGYGCNCSGNSSLFNSTLIGHNCQSADNNTFTVGGNDVGVGGLGYTRYQDLLIKKKNRLLCGYQVLSGTTVNLTYEVAEYIFIYSSSVTTINLPTPQYSSSYVNVTNIGANFKIVRAYSGTWTNITINAPAGFYITFNNVDSGTYAFSNTESYVHLACCTTTSGNPAWAVVNSQKIAPGYLTTANASTTYQTISGMSSYLLSTTASSTYQTISGMSSYLLSTTASSTYLTQASATTNYLTKASAISTYQTISNTTSILNAFGRSNFNTYLSVTANNSTITNTNTPEFIVLNSGSITNITLPFLDSSKVGMRLTIIKGVSAYGKAITIYGNAGDTIYNTQTSIVNTETLLNVTANYLCFVCVNSGTTFPTPVWIAITGQDYFGGTFNLSGRYYIGSQKSLDNCLNTFTIPTPYSNYIAINATAPITITFPKITSLNTGIIGNNSTGVLTSTATGQNLVLRRVGSANLTSSHTLSGYTFTNTFYNQQIFSTANSAITTWATYSLSLVPMSYIKSSQACSISINTTTSVYTITPPLTITGSMNTSTNVFTPSVVTTSSATTSGNTLSLLATNSNIAIGQVVSATGMTTGTTITGGSGLSWTMSNSVTLGLRTFSFYSGNMIASTTYTTTGTGYWFSAATFNTNQTIIYPTAVNYATNNVPTFTLNAIPNQTLTATFNLFPMNLVNNYPGYDPNFNANETLNPCLIGSVYDNVFVNNITLTAGTLVPTITISNAPASTTFTTTSVALQNYGWFQL